MALSCRTLPAWSKVVLFVAAAGLIGRAVLCFGIVPAWVRSANVAHATDAYELLASSLIDRGEFGFGPGGANPTTLRGPGHPGWLAVGMLIGGRGLTWLGFWTSVAGVIAAATVAGVLARRHGALAGLVGGLVAALHPLPGFVSARVMSDEFYAALGWGALAAWVVVDERSDGRWRWVGPVLGGALLALQLLTRNTALITVVALLLLGRGFRKGARRRLALLLTIAFLPPLVWSARSSALEGRAVFVHSSLVGLNYWAGVVQDRVGPSWSAPDARQRRKEILVEAGFAEEEFETFWYTRITPTQAAELEGRLQGRAWSALAGDPFGHFSRWLRGVGRFWIEGQSARRTLQYSLVVCPILLLAAFGAVGVWRSRTGADQLGRILVVWIVLHNLAYAAIVAYARQSVQVHPAVAYLAGVGAASLAAWFSSRAQRHRAPG